MPYICFMCGREGELFFPTADGRELEDHSSIQMQRIQI